VENDRPCRRPAKPTLLLVYSSTSAPSKIDLNVFDNFRILIESRELYRRNSESIAIVYSFARTFRAMSCKAFRIKLRRPAGLMIAPDLSSQGFILFLPSLI